MKSIEIYILQSIHIHSNISGVTGDVNPAHWVQGGNHMKNAIDNILKNNKWFYRGTTFLGRAANGTSSWLNKYWYHYRDTFENSDVFFDDDSVEVGVKWFQIWSRRDDKYENVGILPTGEFIMYSGSNSNRPWGMAPGTILNSDSYRVHSMRELIRDLDLNGQDAMELIALRCACY